MDAYITNANAKRLINSLDISSIDVSKEIFKIEFKWFNQHEIKGLLAFRLLFESPEVFFKQYIIRKGVDTKEYIFEGKSPSYHYFEDCPRLLSEFNNFKIPEEIKCQGDEKISEFRIWFIDNIESLENNPDSFWERMRMRFNLKVRPQEVNYSNSGVDAFDNLNLNELENRITSLITLANGFYNSSVKRQVVLTNFGKISFIYKDKKFPNQNNTGFSNNDIWGILEKFDKEFKEPIIRLLREYYRVKYNPEIKFEGKLLAQLGYNLCKQCEGEYYREYNQKSFAEKIKIDIQNGVSVFSEFDNLIFFNNLLNDKPIHIVKDDEKETDFSQFEDF